MSNQAGVLAVQEENHGAVVLHHADEFSNERLEPLVVVLDGGPAIFKVTTPSFLGGDDLAALLVSLALSAMP